MFRKTFRVLMLAALLLALLLSSVTAESGFTLRNGICFGDSMETVREKETLPFSEIAEIFLEENQLQTESGEVAGFKGVSVRYTFEEGRLAEVMWDMGNFSSNELSDSCYEKLYKAYTSKYGAALGNTNGKCHLITSNAMDEAVTLFMFYSLSDGVGDMRDYAEWIVHYGQNENVKIDLVQFYYGESYSKLCRTICVGYKYFTDDDLDAAIQEKETENQTITNDI